MLNIAFALMGGLILSLFGFYDLVSVGMLEVFGKEISMAGYYLLFIIMGALNNIASATNSNRTIKLKFDDFGLKKKKEIKDDKEL